MPYLYWETDRKRKTVSDLVEMENKKHSMRFREYSRLQARRKMQMRREIGNALPSRRSRTDSEELTTKQELRRAKGFFQVTSKDVPRWTLGGLRWPRFDKSGRLLVKSPLGQYLMDAGRLYEAMSTYRDEKVIEKYLYNDPPLHIRRTLDQSYYWSLKSTAGRDRDQVVYRATRENPKLQHRLEPGTLQWLGHTDYTNEHGCEQCRANSRKLPRLIMVDQLWMWILDEETIITCFPQRYGTEEESGIHRSIKKRLASGKSGSVKSVFDVALVILHECCNAMYKQTIGSDRTPPVRDIFAEAIDHVVSCVNPTAS